MNNESFYSLYFESVSKVILDEASKIIYSSKPWEEKFNLIFSEEIFDYFSAINPLFTYNDPDCSYEDDVMAWFNAALYFAKWNPEYVS